MAGGLKFLFIYGLLSMATRKTETIEIVQQLGVCSAETDKGIIDLSPLSTGNVPKFNINDDQIAWIYHYDPCKEFSIELDQVGKCDKVLVCLTDQNQPYTMITPASTGTETKFQGATQVTGLSGIEIQTSAVDKGNTNTFHVNLVCNEAEEGKIEVVHISAATDYAIKLISKHCCPSSKPIPPWPGHGLSIGSILCILLAIVILLYLSIGILVNYVKNERVINVQLIPNIDFWTALPSYVKDGVNFVINRGQVDSVYGTIK